MKNEHADSSRIEYHRKLVYIKPDSLVKHIKLKQFNKLTEISILTFSYISK